MVKAIPRSVLRSIRALIDDAKAARARSTFVDTIFDEPGSFHALLSDLEASGLADHIEKQRQVFYDEVEGETVRGNPYGFGQIDLSTSTNLYALIRHERPQVVVETGVCNGVSTAFMLQALADNGSGHLTSIDLPEIAEHDHDLGDFWAGKGGAVIPQGKSPGWLIPDALRDRWTLHEGASQDLLEPLLEELGSIDMFMHDSEHSHACMTFEFHAAWQAINQDGVLIADDVDWNTAWDEFCTAHDRDPIPLGPATSFVFKQTQTL